MKKLYSLLVFLGLVAHLAAGNKPSTPTKAINKATKAVKKFKIINGTNDPQALVNMQLSKTSDLSTIDIDPTDYALPDPGSIAVILPDDVNKFYYSFEVPTPNKTYSVTGQASSTPATYKLKYISSIDIMVLNKVS